jgi:hypothetical protein
MQLEFINNKLLRNRILSMVQILETTELVEIQRNAIIHVQN